MHASFIPKLPSDDLPQKGFHLVNHNQENFTLQPYVYDSEQKSLLIFADSCNLQFGKKFYDFLVFQS